MKNSFLSFIMIMAAVLFLCTGCGAKYDFKQSLPYVNARMNEVFPEFIRNSPGTTTKLDLPDDRYMGFTVSYLDNALSITVIKCVDKELTFEQLLVQKEPTIAALEYFNRDIKAKFAAMPVHTFGYKDGFLQAAGKDQEGRGWLAWVNSLWVFMLSGKDKEHFTLAVRACRFVSFAGKDE